MLIGPQNSSVETLLAANIQAVRAQIAAAAAIAQRSVDSVTLVAVSKGHGAEMVRGAAAAGAANFGESYLQEALPKMQSLQDLALTWHFIGRLQANKTRPIAEHFDWVHGVDRLLLAERLSAQRPHHAAALNLCLQVNIAADSAKAGLAPALVADLALAVRGLPKLQLRGLMCILPAGLSAADNRQAFGAMRRLLLQINARGGSLDTLSMGMSADFSEAIIEGATMIRVGTAIFGARPPPPPRPPP
jgi:pyridoxal phosphate enzyme (YggS family)